MSEGFIHRKKKGIKVGADVAKGPHAMHALSKMTHAHTNQKKDQKEEKKESAYTQCVHLKKSSITMTTNLVERGVFLGQPALLNDRRIQEQLPVGPLNDLLLNGTFGDKSEHFHRLRLPDTVSTVHSLQVNLLRRSPMSM